MSGVRFIKRVIKFVVSVLVFCWDAVVEIFMRMVGIQRPVRCVVLYYHTVKREQRKRFGRQLDEILRIATPIWADQPQMMVNKQNYCAITFDDGYKSFRDQALPELVDRRIPVHLFVPTGYLGYPPGWLAENDPERKREIVMSPEELRALDSRHVAIGSHCVSHRSLTSLSDAEAEKEITESKRALEEILGREVSTLSFPHGCHRAKHIEYARQAGYKKLFSISSALAFKGGDEYVVDRVRVDPEDWMPELSLKVRGCYRWMADVSRLLALARARFRCV